MGDDQKINDVNNLSVILRDELIMESDGWSEEMVCIRSQGLCQIAYIGNTGELMEASKASYVQEF
jgi:hypothetical protein